MKKRKNSSKAMLPRRASPFTRITCKISEQTEKTLGFLTKDLQLTVKRLFEIALDIEKIQDRSKVKKETEDESARTIRKTFVISTKIMKKIKLLTKKLEFSSQDDTMAYLISIVATNLALMYEKGKLENIMDELEILATQLDDSIKRFVDPEHPVIKRLSLIATIAMNLYNAIDNYLINRTPIDPEDLSQS